jgi:hypothetical protein
MTRVVISDAALRDVVREALNGTGWSNEDAGDVNVNPVVDPSATVTDPVNPDFTPQTKTEFGIAVNQLVKNLPDGDMPVVYATVKKALDQKTEKEEITDAEQAALAGGSQQAIDDVQDEKRHEGKRPMDNKQLEEMLRAQIRKALTEQPTAIPAGTVDASLDEEEDPADVAADEDPDEPTDAHGRPKKRTKAYKPGALGGMADVGGASFDEIAKEEGMSVAGAKQLVDKSLEKLKFLWKLSDDERDIMVLTAANEYIRYLAKTGELTAPDVQLMKDHPTIVTELDGFREFLHNYVRKARKEGQKVSTFGEARIEPGSQIKMKSVSGEHPKATPPGEQKPGVTKAKTASGKSAQVDWNGLDEDEATDEADVPGKPIVPGQQIRMKSLSGEHPKAASPGEKRPSVTKLKTASGRDSEIDWGGLDEEDEMDEAEVSHMGTCSAVDKASGWRCSLPAKHKGWEHIARTEDGKEAKRFAAGDVQEGEMDEADDKWKAERPQGCKCPDDKRSNKRCPIHGVASEGVKKRRASMEYLTEAVADAVYQDKRGPYLVYEGLEVRPKDPNRTQYKAGQRVTVKNSGMRNGCLVAQMPNGELWRSEARKPSKKALKG